MKRQESTLPIAYKYKILIPGVCVYRLVKAVLKKRKHIKNEINVVNKI